MPFQSTLDCTPASILALRTEANLGVVTPWFERSLAVPGDVAEFGCFRGTMSIKYAFALKALGLQKTVYAFDTFDGFHINDPAGGQLGIGAYSDNQNAFEELTKWSRVLPVVPVKGDARTTCRILTRPLSFLWLDIDMDVLMDPVLKTIRPLLTCDTIIGLDDYGRPETPTVKPWADRMEAENFWTKLEQYPEYIAFYQVK